MSKKEPPVWTGYQMWKMKEALSYFPDTTEFQVDYIPNSFENGTPNNPRTLYILVELDYEPEPEIQNRLIELGWFSEDGEGYNWIIHF